MSLTNKCDFSELLNNLGGCREVDEVFVKIKECDRDVSGHLKYHKVNLNEKLTEWQLILARAGNTIYHVK